MAVEELEYEPPFGGPVTVPWPISKPGGTLWTDLDHAERTAYIAHKQDLAEQAALSTVLDALANLLEGSGTQIRTERNQPPPPPQPGQPSPHIAFERPPGARPIKKARRKAKS